MCKNTRMSIDSSLVRSLNNWGEHYQSLVRICSNDLVYIVILLSVLWFLLRILQAHPLRSGVRDFITNLLTKGFLIFLIPAGIAILISESISAIYVRQRPFVADSNVKLLVPHSADGGMPSHHIVFMVTLVASIYFYDKRVATLLAILTAVTGFARVVAGIHYPSDIIVGAVIALGIVFLYRRVLPRRFLRIA